MIKTDYIIDDGAFYDKVEANYFANSDSWIKYCFCFNKELFYENFNTWLRKRKCRVDFSCRFIFESEEDMVWFKLTYG